MIVFSKRVISLFYFFTVFLNSSLTAQISHTDSLQRDITDLDKVVHGNLKNDTDLFRTCIDVAKIITTKDPDSAMALADKIINVVSLYYKDELLTNNAIKEFYSAAYNQKGIIFSNRAAYFEAKENYKKALAIRLDAGDKKSAANTLNNLGVVAKNEGDYPEAIRYHLEALKIRELILDSAGIASSYNNMGSVFMMQQNYKESIRYYEMALAIRIKSSDKRGIASTLNNIGNNYTLQEVYNKAKENYSFALQTAIEIGDKKLMAECYNNMGNNFYKQDQNAEARKNFYQALSLQTEIGDLRGILTTNKNIGWTFISEKTFEQAVLFFNKSLAIALQINAKDQEMILYRDFAEMNARMKNYEQAFYYQRKYSELRDTLLSSEKNQQIAELQTRFETEKKDREISLLKAETSVKNAELKSEKTFRNAILFGSIMAFLLIILLMNRYRVITEERKKAEKAGFEKELHELQMKALRSQMNPHFIFNCLNSVQRYILKNDKNNAVEYLQKFATLMRLILDNSEKNMVSLHDEIQMLELYIHLEALRLDQGLDFEMQIDPLIDQENMMIPSMILQPYVENAFIHGLMHKEEKGKIKVEIIKEGDLLKCIIEDNGIGRSKAAEIKNRKTIKHISKGLSITKARVDLLNQINNSSNSITVYDLVGEDNVAEGTRVEVLIPVS